MEKTIPSSVESGMHRLLGQGGIRVEWHTVTLQAMMLPA